MEIQATRMHVLPNRGDGLLAICDLAFDGEFVVKGVRVCAGADGKPPWVAMPGRPDQDGKYHDTAFPVTAEAREKVNSVVLAAYRAEIDKDTSKETTFTRGISSAKKALEHAGAGR